MLVLRGRVFNESQHTNTGRLSTRYSIQRVTQPCPATGAQSYGRGMCRNIHTLHNFEPAATSDEVNAAALQYVRKIAGTTKPSTANQDAFDHAVHEIAHITQHLLDDLVATTPPKNREEEAAKARARAIRSGRYAAASA